MDKHPIRRKFIDNPYTLSSSTKDNLYIISFIDSNGIVQNVKVDKEVYDLFDENILKEKFSIPDGLIPIALIMLGYKSEDCPYNLNHDKRKTLDEIVEYF